MDVSNITSFDNSMIISKNYECKELVDKWECIKKIYNTNICKKTIHKIPKIIHQIWLGSPVPENIIKFAQTIKDSNPDYKYIMWTDETVANYNFKNKSLFLENKNFGQKSDILRYAILEEIGGIYLDTDFVGVKSFDSLLHLDFFVGVSYDKEPTVYNGLIGAAPNNKIIQESNNISEIRNNDNMDVIITTGPWFLTKKIFSNYKDAGEICVLPLSYFYPFPNDEKCRIYGNDYTKYITNDTICVHLWHSKWFI
jgi:mannosyltransferase OCH1-like enzyme